jgi:hypothetical protein
MKMLFFLLKLGGNLIVSSIAGYLGTLALPMLTPLVDNLSGSMIDRQPYQSILTFVLLAAVPFGISFAISLVLALLFNRRKPQKQAV